VKDMQARIDTVARQVYGDLKAAERVRLSIEHNAAGDHDEAQRIDDETPIGTYRIPDPHWSSRVFAAWHLVREMVSAIGAARAQLRLMEALEAKCRLATTVGVNDHAEVLGTVTQKAQNSGEPLLERATRLFRAHETALEPLQAAFGEWGYLPILMRVRVLWKAFDACSREHLLVDGRTLFKGTCLASPRDGSGIVVKG